MLKGRYTLSMLALGVLGAGLSIALLPLIPGNAASTPYGQLMAEPLPNIVSVGTIGFGAGVLVAVVWSLVCQIMAPQGGRP